MSNGWFSVEDALPPTGVEVLIVRRTPPWSAPPQNPRHLLGVGHWIEKFKKQAYGDGWSYWGDDTDEDEVSLTAFIPQGWYVWNEEEGMYLRLDEYDGMVTHWQAAPKIPGVGHEVK